MKVWTQIERTKKCRGKNLRMHDFFFTHSSFSICLVNFCVFFFSPHAFRNESLKWYILMFMMVTRAQCIRIFVWTKYQTHIVHNHILCVKSNEGKKGIKERKRKQSPRSLLWKIHFDDPIYLFLYIRIFADCVRQVLFENFIELQKKKIWECGRLGSAERKSGIHRAKWFSWIASTHLLKSYRRLQWWNCIFAFLMNHMRTSTSSHTHTHIQSNLFMHSSTLIHRSVAAFLLLLLLHYIYLISMFFVVVVALSSSKIHCSFAIFI